MPSYIELRCRSAFSFLTGASLPEDLACRAAALGYPALALGDCDGLFGAPRFHKAATRAGLRALVGAEVTLEGNTSLYVLAESRAGYRNLCRLITQAKLRAPKGKSVVRWSDIEEYASGLLCLAGGERSPLIRALAARDADGAARIAERLLGIFGRAHLFVDVQRHLDPTEERLNRAAIDLACHHGIPTVATNDVRHSMPADRALLDVLTCIHEKTPLDAAGRLLLPNAERHLKSPTEMTALFADLPEAVAATSAVAERCEFTLADLGYRFPDYPLPARETPATYLRRCVFAGVRERYQALTPRVRAQLEHELTVIERLDLAGYFLIVWDIVQFCRRKRILVQGRGSAANSAVCYALGITAVDPVGMELLFERFLSEERGEWPDIDLDLPSGNQREKVIQYVYRRYGPHGAGMTANVITYRTRSAVREVGKVLGLAPAQVDRLAKLLREYEYRDELDDLAVQLRAGGVDPAAPRVRLLVQLVRAMQHLPRHLGQHSGGMIIAAGRLDEIVPLEPATMPDRVVIQWDKDDCADLGIIKVDLLGLGMMAVLEQALPLVAAHDGTTLDLAHLPSDDPTVYAMLQAADTVGVFQVESRAQMATLPRLKPTRFYDLVVEVAIIRPGPIVGQMVHPYLRRRAGREPVTYPHPLLEPILRRTLGVPLFQEQLLRIAMTVAGFSGGEAEELRRAMGFKRSVERMKQIESRLRHGMAARGIVGRTADEIVRAITSFALYGFPESHAASFALIAYASAYLKAHHPSAFFCAMLNVYPLGFYTPATLIKDAQRHDVRVLPIDVTRSKWMCTIESGALRIGLRYVTGLREAAGSAIEAAHAARPFDSLTDFATRCQLRRTELDTLAHIGALGTFGLTRRAALWQVAALECDPESLLARMKPNTSPSASASSTRPTAGNSPLPPMSALDETLADYRGTGLTTGPQIITHLRPTLTARGVLRTVDLRAARSGEWVRTAGHVIVRQRPGTAKGFLFLTLEDETGMANAVVTPDLFQKHRAVLHASPLLQVEGLLQKIDGVIHVRARRFVPLGIQDLPAASVGEEKGRLPRPGVVSSPDGT
jgi:error-prone DNA polymerase